jgi:hypothetical protein
MESGGTSVNGHGDRRRGRLGHAATPHIFGRTTGVWERWMSSPS